MSLREVITASAQISVPYYNNFDNAADTIGWLHYAISGTDNWERGIPNGVYLNTASSSPNVWGTNLDGITSANSVMALETPDFNLSDTTKIFLLNFCHEYETYSYHGGNIQYSVDLGVTWILLNGGTTEKQNWYNNTSCAGMGGQPTWSGNNYSSFLFSTHSLAFLKGQAHVRFRFRYGGSSNPQEGWLIDNFSIIENVPNITAVQGSTYNASKHFLTFDVVTPLIYNGLLPPSFSNITNYYFSKDNVLDAGDSLLGNKTQTINGTISNWTKTFNMVPNLKAGNYYIFYTHDFANNLNENNESDNTNYCILHIDSTFNIPEYKEGFEDTTDYWKASASPLYWVKGYSNIHQAENPHTGMNSWYIKNLPDNTFGATAPAQYLEGPYLDLTPASNNVLCFWYKMKRSYSSYNQTSIEFSTVNTPPSFTSIVPIPTTRISGWDCHCESLSALNGRDNVKLRFKFSGSITFGLFDQNVNIDDIYIGQPKPDLSIENKNKITTTQNFNTDTLTYTLFNSGLSVAGTSITEFYWSNDSLLDTGDILIATVNEPALIDTSFRKEKVAFTKPTLATGQYYIIYKLDAGNVLNEMREENNIGYYKAEQVPIFSVPYFNDFETQIDGWSHSSSIGHDDWKWGEPSGIILTSAFSGTKAFHTTADTLLSVMSRQHLYTPVFDLTSLSNPVMEFDMNLNGDGSCHCFNSKMNMSYSIDDGATWIVLDTTNQSFTRWYYPMEYEDYGGIDRNYYARNYTQLLFEGNEYTFANSDQYNSRDANRNTHYVYDLSFLSNQKNIQFRYNIANHNNYASSPNAPREGAVIDNFKIGNKFIDLLVNYKKSLMISSLNQSVKFSMDIKNQGNFISNPSNIKFYISSDTVLDASDFFLGQDTVRATRPDMKYYLNEIFAGPSDLSNYSFLLYQIDPLNTNAESNETNNIGYWKLSLDSISNYPYYEAFNDTIVDGWNHYVIDQWGQHLKNQYRFRNIVAPSEYLYQSAIKSGEMFTDRINGTMYISDVPYWYLETPAFNFSNKDSIFLSFDLMCTGGTGVNNNSGGNLDFSTDGGNTWQLLTVQYGNAFNWYNKSLIENLFNESGWLHNPPGYGVAVLDSTSFNLSFLRGKQNVVFRFKYRSNNEVYGSGTVQGMRIDNFRIEGFTVDYIALDSMVSLSIPYTQSDFDVNYSIKNTGQSNGRITTTKFYWSNDSIFDSNDSLVKTITENRILSGTTLNASANIIYPAPITQQTYYLFYFTDADSNLEETSETNNVGSYKINFSSYPNYFANIEWDTVSATTLQPTCNITYSIINNGSSDGTNSITTFYWSPDSIFNINDQDIQTVNEGPILSGDTLISVISIIYPTPLTQSTYYLFYTADTNDSILEANENDNTGVFKIFFDDNGLAHEMAINNIDMYTAGKTVFIKVPATINFNPYTINLITGNGSLVYNLKLTLNPGLNSFSLPESLSGSFYWISLYNSKGVLTKKIIIPN